MFAHPREVRTAQKPRACERGVLSTAMAHDAGGGGARRFTATGKMVHQSSRLSGGQRRPTFTFFYELAVCFAPPDWRPGTPADPSSAARFWKGRRGFKSLIGRIRRQSLQQLYWRSGRAEGFSEKMPIVIRRAKQRRVLDGLGSPRKCGGISPIAVARSDHGSDGDYATARPNVGVLESKKKPTATALRLLPTTTTPCRPATTRLTIVRCGPGRRASAFRGRTMDGTAAAPASVGF